MDREVWEWICMQPVICQSWLIVVYLSSLFSTVGSQHVNVLVEIIVDKLNSVHFTIAFSIMVLFVDYRSIATVSFVSSFRPTEIVMIYPTCLIPNRTSPFSIFLFTMICTPPEWLYWFFFFFFNKGILEK